MGTVVEERESVLRGPGGCRDGNTPLPPMWPEAKGEARLGLFYLGFAFSAAKTCMF